MRIYSNRTRKLESVNDKLSLFFNVTLNMIPTILYNNTFILYFTFLFIYFSLIQDISTAALPTSPSPNPHALSFLPDSLPFLLPSEKSRTSSEINQTPHKTQYD